MFWVPLNPEKEKPANGLDLFSVFLSSTALSCPCVTAGAGLLLKVKPPRAGLFSVPDLGVPNIELGKTEDVGLVSAAVEVVTLVVSCPFAWGVAAEANLGGENENRALGVVESAADAGRENENEGFVVPNAKLEGATDAAAVELGVVAVPRLMPVAVVDGVVADKLKAGVAAGAVVTAGDEVDEKLKAGVEATDGVPNLIPPNGADEEAGTDEVEVGVVDTVGIPNLMPLKEAGVEASVEAGVVAGVGA